MRKQIMVTDGAGFIGSHLCDNLLNGRHPKVRLREGLDRTIEYFRNQLASNEG